jgi:hypothetical protein
MDQGTGLSGGVVGSSRVPDVREFFAILLSEWQL